MIALRDNPPVRSPSLDEPAGADHAWWIAHTKSRSEKAFAFDLLAADVGYFLPMTQSITLSGGRRRTLLKPLFPSYVFFRGDPDARQIALGTGRLCQVLPVRDQAQLDRELASLHAVLSHGDKLDPYPFVAVGKRCRVASGTLEGVEGIVLDRSRLAKVVLQVTMLGRGVLLEIEAGLLDVAD